MKITSYLFEAYLKCPTKCFLRSLGEQGTGNAYADWLRTQADSYRATQIKRFTAEAASDAQIISDPHTEDMKMDEWRYAVDVVARAQDLESHIDMVERFPLKGGDNPGQFIPIRFLYTNKTTKDDRLVLAFDAFVLSKMLGCEASLGKIIYGDQRLITNVKVSSLENKVQRLIGNVTELLSKGSPPDLALNRHCIECEFKSRCRQKAIEKDDLSLLFNMPEKERARLHSKGIFTVTQLSYTFRPRRRPKRLRDKKEKYHHSLKALSIRENKIHIVGNPELKINGTPVYVDVEGLPDRNFYYLIGVRVGSGDSVAQHSLWADTREDERRIWNEFLNILSTVPSPVLIHYGSFESVFIKRMLDRYGGPLEEAIVGKALELSVNLLSVIYSQVYFPGFSNGLKDAASFLGFNWTSIDSSGTQSIVWRHHWEVSKDISTKERLVRYNSDDCEALNIVADTIRQFNSSTSLEAQGKNGEGIIVRADSEKFPERSAWRTFKSPISTFEYINSTAHWDYQRDRVYVRSGTLKQKIKKLRSTRRLHRRVEKVVIWERLRSCPACHRSFRVKGPVLSKTLQDIIFGRHSLKRRLVRYVFQTYRCQGCANRFGVPERFKLCRKYGWNLIAYFFYHVVDLYIPQRTVVQSFNRLFGFDLYRSTLGNFKTQVAGYYAETKQQILERIICGNLIHADETRANVKGKSAFVWVFTNFHEVVYILADSREGEIVKKLLADFKGILVSDFYAAYDSISCPQQKCLIHLMRDLNDEVLNNPFDEQLKQVVTGFGNLLKPIIETVDRYGLKRHFLRKHLKQVDHFYRQLERADYQSEAALKCRQRFKKNQNKLFTFLRFDGIPWNNNNAEHAIKAFARLRDIIEGTSTEKGTQEYLTLLSVCQTCKYQGLDFLDFLRSGEKDIQVFGQGRRRLLQKLTNLEHYKKEDVFVREPSLL